MTNRDNQIKTYLTDAEKQKLEQFARKADKSVSALLREAVLEYTDRDRTERIEHEVREVNDKIDRVLSLVENNTHTQATTKSVPEKAQSIVQTLYENHEMPVKNETVEIVIENYAGGDARTLKKYKEHLKKRELLFEHPNDPMWTDEFDEWVMWEENAHVNVDVHEVTQEYGVAISEYAEVADQL